MDLPRALVGNPLAPIRFSTDRFDVWREEIGARIARTDYDTPDRSHFHADLCAMALPRISVSRARLSVPSRMSRTRAMLRDGDDDVVLFVGFGGACEARVEDNFYRLESGGAMLVSNHLCSSNATLSPSTVYSLRLSRDAARCLVPSLDAALYRAIPAGDPAIALLKAYVDALLDASSVFDSQAVALADEHLRDLVAHIVNPAVDPARATRGGVRTARFKAVLNDIAAHLADPVLCAAAVGLRLGLSGRYVHQLFEGSGFTFSSYLREQRLLLVRRLLADPLYAHRRINDICSGAGFSDLSHFNRAFRARFGCTPMDARRGG